VIREVDVTLADGRVLHAYDAGADADAARLVVVWHHGTPNIGLPPEPLFPASDRLRIRWIGYDRPGYGGSDPAPDRDVGSAAGDVAALAETVVEAHRLGLVNQVVAPEKLEDAFDALLARLLDKPADVLALGKRTFYRQLEMGLAEAYDFTTGVMVENAGYRNFEEGLAAFVEKRKPAWQR